MHRLLKRQLKKVGAQSLKLLDVNQQEKLIGLINQAYFDADEDRLLLENSLDVSSMEMQNLYDKIKSNAQSKIQQSEEKYNRLVRNLKQYYFFYTLNIKGEYTYVSDSILDMLGYTVDQFKNNNQSYYTTDTINDAKQEYLEKSRKGEKLPPYILNMLHQDGSIKHIEVMQLPIFNEQGEVIEIEGIARDITEHTNAREQLNYIALHDTLTGIANRYSLFAQVEKIIVDAHYSQGKFAVFFIDLDHFKKINDALGHNVGDKLLQAVVAKITPTIRHRDVFARIGGDEFILVLTDIEEKNLVSIVNKMLNLLREDWIVDNYELKISSSIGISVYPYDGTDIQTLMKNADIAMFKAKKSGRDNFSFFTEHLNLEVQTEIRLERDMVKALKKNEFVLHFQPKVTVQDNLIIGAEALIRWYHPELGLITPNRFIPLAESTGFILKIGRWVIEESCRAIARVNNAHHKKFHLALNLSTRQIENDNLFDIIDKAIKKTSIDPSQIHLEITESIIMDNSKAAVAQLNKIKTLGVHICMDDFGTGYSSLSCLHQFPIDTLKIDKAFIDQIQPEGSEAVLLDTIIVMGKTLGLVIVAEGVEHEYQKDYLEKKGCLFYQGYLFSKPISEVDYIKLVKGT
ncbi:MAG: diguanylate cyclase (GGDEF)-like protein/PAS domain S-box-containing protein [Cellvibrionaceae bacterium]|jgi:diguanylate cyclase (GGDEF)-like protein/PAS domain S-box-containing protein